MEGEQVCKEEQEKLKRELGKEEEGGTETETETEEVEKKEEEEEEEELIDEEEEEEEEASPRGVLEIAITTGSSDSDQSSISSSDRSSSFGSSTSSSSEEKTAVIQGGGGGGGGGWFTKELQWKTMVDRIKKRSVGGGRRFSIIPLLGLAAGNELSRKSLGSSRGKRLGRNRSAEETLLDCGDFTVPKPSWRNFTYKELALATLNFSPEKLVGKGGHAEVYKGSLPDGQVVAVKRITKQDKNDDDRVGDFLAELGIIAHINHPNAAKLIGFSVDGGLHLVLQFLPHGSLASVLHGSGEISVDWKARYKVAMGLAEGLKYLHSGCQRRIIHRDITASNILLTEDYEPQISDFGLAKWLPEKWVHHVVSPIEGTFGYMAPEYFMHGIVHEKTDVFAFGVLLLELLTGRRAVNSSRQSLVMWAKPLLEKNDVKELVDPRLENQYDMLQLKRVMYTASTCLHHLPNMRPNMKRVVHLLKGENEALDVKQKSMGGRALLVDACDLEDYTSTTYLKDLNRHMELVME